MAVWVAWRPKRNCLSSLDNNQSCFSDGPEERISPSKFSSHWRQVSAWRCHLIYQHFVILVTDFILASRFSDPVSNTILNGRQIWILKFRMLKWCLKIDRDKKSSGNYLARDLIQKFWCWICGNFKRRLSELSVQFYWRSVLACSCDCANICVGGLRCPSRAFC